MNNFSDIESVVLERGSGVRIDSKDELKEKLVELIENETTRNDLRNKCLEVFESEKSSLEHNLEIIVKSINR
jgi:3-deoxy-D-manno-octulosonic-acid transferase